MKKRIFIYMHYLEIGGAETSLIGLLHALDKEKVDVDLFLNEHRGEMMKFIPDWVNLLSPSNKYSAIEQPLIKVFFKLQWGIVVGRLLAKINFKLYQKKNHSNDGNAIFGYIGKYVTPFLPSLKKMGKYDIAISWLTPHNIVLDKVEAKKKICWIHTDYSSISVNTCLELPVWKSYDKIISISDKVTKSFSSVFPELKDRIVKIEPILSQRWIEIRAEEFIPKDMKRDGDELLFLSVGRYCYAKNFESIPQICRRLKDNGVNLKWHIIGYGAADKYIRDEIKKYNVDDNVILLGKKENPYPYIKNCDIYIQPSRYEGKSVTVLEAQILGKPVIITNYPTANSQINNEKDGFIGPTDIKAFANYIVKLILQHLDKIKTVRNNLETIDFIKIENLKKFYSLLS